MCVLQHAIAASSCRSCFLKKKTAPFQRPSCCAHAAAEEATGVGCSEMVLGFVCTCENSTSKAMAEKGKKAENPGAKKHTFAPAISRLIGENAWLLHCAWCYVRFAGSRLNQPNHSRNVLGNGQPKCRLGTPKKGCFAVHVRGRGGVRRKC